MTSEEVQKCLSEAFPKAEIKVESPDNVHFSAYIKAPQFHGLTKVAQQRLVYQVLHEQIRSGEVHALSLQTEAM